MANFNQRVGASFVSSMLISLILYPLDTMKRCLQLNGGRGQHVLYRSAFEVFTKLPNQQGGVTALYRGVHLFFVKELICAFAQASIYESLNPTSFGLQ